MLTDVHNSLEIGRYYPRHMERDFLNMPCFEEANPDTLITEIDEESGVKFVGFAELCPSFHHCNPDSEFCDLMLRDFFKLMRNAVELDIDLVRTSFGGSLIKH